MTNFEKVGKFMKTFGQEVKSKSSLSSDKINILRISLIEEELDELKQAINQKNLLLLKVKTIGLKSLIWEQGSDGYMFPHLYSKLDISDVVDEIDITLKNDGTHELPDNYWWSVSLLGSLILFIIALTPLNFALI